MSGNGHRTFRYSVPITFIKRCKKIQRTRKNIVSCARQGLKHLLSSFPQVHCNGCTEQRPMMTAGKSATSHCLATSWQGWRLPPEKARVSAGESKGFRRRKQGFPPGTHAFRRSGAVFRGTTCCTVEHGKEAHTQPACHAHGLGACQYPPFKGGIRDDLSVPLRVENSGGWQHRQSLYPRTEGRIRAVRSRTDNGSVLQKRFPLFHSPAFCWNQSVLAMASGRPVWHGALAFSCEVCRGITAYGQ